MEMSRKNKQLSLQAFETRSDSEVMYVYTMPLKGVSLLRKLAYPKGYILPANPLSPPFLSCTHRTDMVVEVSTVFLSNALEIQAWHASVEVSKICVVCICIMPEKPVPYIHLYFCLKFSLLFCVQPSLL